MPKITNDAILKTIFNSVDIDLVIMHIEQPKPLKMKGIASLSAFQEITEIYKAWSYWDSGLLRDTSSFLNMFLKIATPERSSASPSHFKTIASPKRKEKLGEKKYRLDNYINYSVVPLANATASTLNLKSSIDHLKQTSLSFVEQT